MFCSTERESRGLKVVSILAVVIIRSIRKGDLDTDYVPIGDYRRRCSKSSVEELSTWKRCTA
jgi:hypothetical protein